MRKLLWIAALLLPSAPAFGAELTLLAGYRSGGPSAELPLYACIAIPAPCPQPSVDARDGEAFGLIVDFPIRGKELMFEVLLNHQSGKFEDEGLAFIEVFPPPRRAGFDLTYLHAGLLRQWPKPRVSPFAAVGVGIAQLEVDRPLFFFFETIDEDRLSASLAGGLKIRLNDWFALRVEGRGYWADMPESAGEDLFQLELSSGVSFKL